MLKTPITYYGGKQTLASKILPLIPEHVVYNEPFFGGGAIYFQKDPSKIECINDTNNQVINFYRTAKKQFVDLKEEIDCTLHSEEQYRQARKLYFECKDEDAQQRVLRAWALFVLANQTYLNRLDGTWAYGKDRNVAKTFHNKKINFDERYMSRLENTQIFCRDALRVIQNVDSVDTFHFVDPPYINTDCGHYKGYTIDDYKRLLELLSTIKGKFLLTSFPTDILDDFTRENGWKTIKNEMAAAAGSTVGKKKIEVFTMNY